MPFNKVHKRRNNVARQLLGGTTTTHATSASSAAHGVNPTGPPLYISTTASTAAGGTTTTGPSAGTGGTTTTGTGATDSVQTTGTSLSDTLVPTTTAAAGGGAVQATSNAAAGTNAAQTTAGSRTVTTRAIASSTSSTASPTTTSDDSGGMSLGSIAGAAAAAVLGIGIIAAFFVWFIRRRNKNSDPDEEPFNRHSFLRQSTVIPDNDGPVPSRTRASPPPSMSERQPTPMYGATQTFDNGQNNFGYNTQPSYSGGQLYAPNAANPFGPGGAPATPLPPANFGYEQPGYNNGGYSDLTRGSVVQDFPPSHMNGPMSPPLDNPHSPNYPGPETFAIPHEPIPNHDNHFNGPEPVSGMYAQPGFPELTPATTSAQQGQVIAVSSSVHDGRETPVQLGFAPVQMPNGNQTAAQPAQPGPNGKKRPVSAYDDEDAYGGI